MRIRSGDVCLSAFVESMTETVLALRNHPTVRAGMRDPRPVPADSHRDWVRANVLDARRVHLFLIEQAGQARGIALLRDLRDDQAEIGVMVPDASRHRLVCYKAALLVGYYGLEVLGLQRLVSLVPRLNEGALRFNLACGFEAIAAPGEVYHELVLTREASQAHRTHLRFRKRKPIEVEYDPTAGDVRTD